jgi:3-dehydroquinate synthase
MKMNKINLKTSLGNSEIIIQEDGVGMVNKWMKEHHPESKMVVITDTNVGGIYKELLAKYFPNIQILSVVAGDVSKRLAVVKQLAGELLNMGFTRSDVIVGFGGGMVTDLAGFVASIYMRGTPLILVPTSLMGMVDAAIGGKTSVNLEAKNILGTFYPAELVLIDLEFVKGLTDRAITTGIAEVIKYAATIDGSLYDDLMKNEIDLETIIIKSVQAKVDVVNKDLKESGLRKVMNFGHTFGHAIEQISEYKLFHGEAISIGMTLANKVAQKLGKQTEETGKKIEEMLKKFKLPYEMPSGIQINDLVELMKKDKKRHGDKITFIISTDIGKYEMLELSPEELIELVQ